MNQTDDLGLSPEFADPNNFDAFENEPVTPQGSKSCVCGREVIRFDVYRSEPLDDVGHQLVGGIVGVLADGSTCCSALEYLSAEESTRMAAEFNAREYVALSQEV